MSYVNIDRWHGPILPDLNAATNYLTMRSEKVGRLADALGIELDEMEGDDQQWALLDAEASCYADIADMLQPIFDVVLEQLDDADFTRGKLAELHTFIEGAGLAGRGPNARLQLDELYETLRELNFTPNKCYEHAWPEDESAQPSILDREAARDVLGPRLAGRLDDWMDELDPADASTLAAALNNHCYDVKER